MIDNRPMGLYIHYEFVTVDRPLDPDQIDELRAISTRAEITPSSFTNEYNWSDLAADPTSLMARYFDVGLRWTSNGDRLLLLRLPHSRATRRTLAPYFDGEGLSLRKFGDHLVLEINFEDEDADYDSFEWSLGPLMPLRAALLTGDLRPAYVAWLWAATRDRYEDELIDHESEEPAVPPGLAQPSSAISALVDFLEVDQDSFTAAAEGSPASNHDEDAVLQWVRSMSGRQQQQWLLRAIERPELTLGAQMISTFREQNPTAVSSVRTLGELRARAEVIRKARELEAFEASEVDRARREAEQECELQQLRKRWATSWTRLERLINDKQYDEAAELTMKLRDADAGRRTPDFEERLASLKGHTGRRRGYWQRVNIRL